MAEHQSFSSRLVTCTRSPSRRLHSVAMGRSPTAPSYQQLAFFSNSASSPLASGTRSWCWHPTDLPPVSHFLSAHPLTSNAAWPSLCPSESFTLLNDSSHMHIFVILSPLSIFIIFTSSSPLWAFSTLPLLLPSWTIRGRCYFRNMKPRHEAPG